MRTTRSTLSVLSAVTVGGLALAGCGNAIDGAIERGVEEAVEQAAGEGAEIDIDSDGDGSVSVQTSEGSFNLGGGEIPDSFPESMPLPDGFTPQSSFDTSADGEVQVNVSGGVDGSVSDVADALRGQLEDAGWTIDGENTMSSDGGELVNYQVSGNGFEGLVGVVQGSEGTTSVTYTLTSASE